VYAGGAAELHTNFLSLTQCPSVRSLMLTFVYEFVAMPTSKDSPTIENRHAPPATLGGTEKPGPVAAIVAGRPVNPNWIGKVLWIFPISPLVGVLKEKMPRLAADLNATRFLAV